jgi:hypothetical protein
MLYLQLMRFHTIAVIFSILFYSCTSGEQSKAKLTKETSPEVIEQTTSNEDESLKLKAEELQLVFKKLISTYPSDSTSLTRFYFKTFKAETDDRMQKQIDRINGMLEPQIVKNYNKVTKELKPLLLKITEANQITKDQALKLANLYTIYDDYRGDALFSQVLVEDENYSLVWKSMKLMVDSSVLDTTYMSTLIQLDNSIRTNVELAEKMGEFVIEAIKNNPKGFLSIYSNRKQEHREEIASHAMMWDDPVKELIMIFENISKDSTDINNRKLAIELLPRIGGTGNIEFLLKNDQAGNFFRKMKTSDALEIARANYAVEESTMELEGDPYKVFKLTLDGEHLLTLEPSDGEVWRIWVYSPKYKTVKGIGVGDSIKEILNKYTFDYLQTEGEGWYFLNVKELEFGLALEHGAYDSDEWWSNGAKFEDIPDSIRVEFIIP